MNKFEQVRVAGEGSFMSSWLVVTLGAPPRTDRLTDRQTDMIETLSSRKLYVTCSKSKLNLICYFVNVQGR